MTEYKIERGVTEVGPGDWGELPPPPTERDVHEHPTIIGDWDYALRIYFRKLLAYNPHSLSCKDPACKWCRDVKEALKPHSFRPG